MPEKPEYVSPAGTEYFAAPASGDELEKLKNDLRSAETSYHFSPNDPDALIMYGRRLAYLWKYRDAILAFTAGIKMWPDNAMLFRHRGHRYISLRQFARAEEDLARAAALKGDSFDIWYHLALARWLQGKFEDALPAYRKSYEVSTDDNYRAAATNWFWLTLKRTGRDKEATELLKTLRPATGEDAMYYYMCLMYKGEKPEQEIAAMMSDLPISHATIGYGTGVWHLTAGRTEQAKKYFAEILTGRHWPGFGFIGAEAEMSRLT